jgi:hypothetical protein
MPTQSIPFAGQTYVDKTLFANAQDAINLYPMRTVQAQNSDKKLPSNYKQEDIVMYPTPGYKWQQNVASYASSGTAIRGLYVINTTLYIVVGNTLLSFMPSGYGNSLATGTFSVLGTLSTSSGRCSIVSNSAQLVISDGTYGYVYNFSSFIFSTISTSGSYPSGGVTNLTFFDSYCIAAQNNSRTVIQSNVLDATTWQALAFDTIVSYPDNVVAVFSDGLQLYIFGPKITEVQADAGLTPYAFQKVPNVLIQAGCAARDSICKIGNTVMFLASDIAGKSYVAALEGYGTKVLSTPPINEAIERYSIISDAFAYVYREGENMFYVITFPSAKATWAYDVKMDMWHKRSINNGADLPTSCILWNGLQIVGDNSGNLYQMSQLYSTYSVYNAGAVLDYPIKRQRVTTHLFTGKTLFFHELWVRMQMGGGFSTNANLANPPLTGIYTPTVVQQNHTGTPTGTINLTSASKSGSLIIVALTQTPYTATISSVTDNLGQTYVSAGARSYDSTSGYTTDIWYKSNSSAGVTSVTAAYSGIYKNMEVTEVAGCRSIAPIDSTAVINSGALTTAPVSGGITTTANNDFIYIKMIPTFYDTATVTYPYTINGNVKGAYKTLGVPVSSETATFGLGSSNYISTYCSSSVAFFAAPSQVPQATLEVSNDYGNTYTVVGTQSLGAIGQYFIRAVWRTLGRFRQAVTFRLTVTDPVGVYIIGAEASITSGLK